METKDTVLQNCTVDGMVIKLPPQQLDRKLYQDVAKSLELIGGKWKGGKIMGFVFPNDPTDLLAQIANGEKRNLKKEFQFFATPAELARELVEVACIYQGNTILEPSAGQGAIVQAIINNTNETRPICGYELMDINRTFLAKIPSFQLLGNDFFECTQKFDRIIANPPFSKNQDIDHIRKMYECLNDGGRLVSVASKHWHLSNNKKETDFRNWLDKEGATVYDIERGKFKDSGTMIESVYIEIDKA